MLQNTPGFPALLSEDRLRDSVDTLLTMQNADGGFASYELIRAGPWLESLNAAEVFGKIMVEYSYPECTTATITGLALFRKYYPNYRTEEIEATIQCAVKFVKEQQRPDGSWYGAWGVCFLYATMFATESLHLVGENYDNSESARRACEFVVSKQREDGGWGESWRSSHDAVYIQHEDSQVVGTSWALIALMNAGYPRKEVLERGAKVSNLCIRQL